jgi:hypothetical protein
LKKNDTTHANRKWLQLRQRGKVYNYLPQQQTTHLGCRTLGVVCCGAEPNTPKPMTKNHTIICIVCSLHHVVLLSRLCSCDHSVDMKVCCYFDLPFTHGMRQEELNRAAQRLTDKCTLNESTSQQYLKTTYQFNKIGTL